MKIISALFLLFVLASCVKQSEKPNEVFTSNDSLWLLKMVKEREDAMIKRDLNAIVKQFDEKATFINGGGFYYEGINEIKEFHAGMFTQDSLTYTYKTGNTLVHSIGNNTALVYYPWQQDWTMKNIQSDTLHEIGLMTIIAVKQNGGWKWRSITNQRTKEFFNDLHTHKAKAVN